MPVTYIPSGHVEPDPIDLLRINIAAVAEWLMKLEWLTKLEVRQDREAQETMEKEREPNFS